MRRAMTSLLLVALVGCNDPSYPTSPLPTAPSTPRAATGITLVFSPSELSIGGGEARVHVETNAGPGVAAARVRVQLETSDGELDAGDITTDGTGHATVTWRGTRSSVITARAGELQTSAQLRVLEPQGVPPMPPPQLPPPAPPAEPLPPLPPSPIPGNRVDQNLVLTITSTPASPIANQSATLAAALTTVDGTAAPAITRYAWDVNADRLPDRSEASPSMTFTAAGPARVLLEIATDAGTIAIADQTLTVLATAPPPPPPPPPALTVSMVSTATTVVAGTPVSFTATPANLNGETVTLYQWDMDPAAGFEGTTIVATRPHTYFVHGTHSARVTITTNTGRTATSAPIQIIVTN